MALPWIDNVGVFFSFLVSEQELYLDPVEAGTLLELLEVSFEYGGTISTSSALLTRKTFVR